jgi:hypothetical protein
VTVELLLAILQARGVQLEAVGDRLRFHPRAAVSEALRRALIRHKPQLLAYLRAAASTPELPLDLPSRAAPPRAPRRGRELWPRDLPGLGPRCLAAYARCAGCGASTWVYYGNRPHCRRCADRAARLPPVVEPSP